MSWWFLSVKTDDVDVWATVSGGEARTWWEQMNYEFNVHYTWSSCMRSTCTCVHRTDSEHTHMLWSINVLFAEWIVFLVLKIHLSLKLQNNKVILCLGVKLPIKDSFEQSWSAVVFLDVIITQSLFQQIICCCDLKTKGASHLGLKCCWLMCFHNSPVSRPYCISLIISHKKKS